MLMPASNAVLIMSYSNIRILLKETMGSFYWLWLDPPQRFLLKSALSKEDSTWNWTQDLKSMNLQPPRENSGTRRPLGPSRRNGIFLGSNSHCTGHCWRMDMMSGAWVVKELQILRTGWLYTESRPKKKHFHWINCHLQFHSAEKKFLEFAKRVGKRLTIEAAGLALLNAFSKFDVHVMSPARSDITTLASKFMHRRLEK